MKAIWLSSIVVAATLAAGSAAAQAPPPPAPGGAFESLSPGNQKIALAIFDSEQRAGATAPTKPLSLDEIAQMKQGGKGWGVIFKDMKSQGLVQDKNLGQAVSQGSSGGGASAARTEITTASGKTFTAGGNARSDAALSQGRGSGPGDARGHAGQVAPAGSANDSVAGASAARGGTASHGGGRGR